MRVAERHESQVLENILFLSLAVLVAIVLRIAV